MLLEYPLKLGDGDGPTECSRDAKIVKADGGWIKTLREEGMLVSQICQPSIFYVSLKDTPLSKVRNALGRGATALLRGSVVAVL